MIPFIDVYAINARFENDFKIGFQNFLDSSYYILGNQVKAFEQAFAAYCGVTHCIGMGNGLDALRLILEGYKLLGKLKDGDEVLVASNTFIATIIAIKQAGLKPILVEVETEKFNFDLLALKQAITPKSKAIMPVHLYGQLAPMEEINALSKEYDLIVIEDAAQAHGAKDGGGKCAGNLGNAGGFSFYPTKNLGALGDGGAVTTNDDALAAVLRKLRNYGTSSKYVNDVLGFNSRLDEIQAAFLNIKLPKLSADNDFRREIAKRYISEIDNSKILMPNYDGTENHIFHLFVVRVENRNEFQQYLNDNKIGSLIHYPIAPHQQNALLELKDLNFPITEMLHNQVISIPISPVMNEAQVSRVIEVLNRY
ncbi:aminotransferase [Patiriisocius marinistellae]|uniref:Aminotransferase n=1 Tax=Patiriisocius marinistellae TaxID=2494560 RepID=A0A5J4G124_9FLAO|nr:DegT/DnrJ/EryC1/StrS family aminotransferase [Patiriisocius marinistellae]GEQ87312.1 aminotransferase [Patiriisocius marinistellae]